MSNKYGYQHFYSDLLNHHQLPVVNNNLLKLLKIVLFMRRLTKKIICFVLTSLQRLTLWSQHSMPTPASNRGGV